jgi:predicted CoA-binding protein
MSDGHGGKHPGAAPDDIASVLRTAHTIAVVGISPRPERDSYDVARYLSEHGYRIIPVNPGVEEILGERCYPDLAAVPAEIRIDVVDIFRRVEFIPEIVDQAIAIGARAVWMQLGLVDAGSAAKARGAGLAVVMDRCMKVELARLLRG